MVSTEGTAHPGFLSTPSARRATLDYDGYCIEQNTFLSTPSARRATACIQVVRSNAWNFYPRPPRGGRQSRSTSFCAPHLISIHALREEGDRCGRSRSGRYRISIHALREEGDPWNAPKHVSGHRFLSTPSARRATVLSFYVGEQSNISIHALCEEGDDPVHFR